MASDADVPIAVTRTGAFFVVAHLVCGLRQVLLAHGVRRELVNGLWGAGLTGAAALSAAITAGLCGLRL